MKNIICFQRMKFLHSCIAGVKYREVFPRVCLEHLNSKNKFKTKDRGSAKSAGPVAIATFATIVNPALRWQKLENWRSLGQNFSVFGHLFF